MIKTENVDYDFFFTALSCRKSLKHPRPNVCFDSAAGGGGGPGVPAAEGGGEAEPGSAQSPGSRDRAQREDAVPQEEPPGGCDVAERHRGAAGGAAEDAQPGGAGPEAAAGEGGREEVQPPPYLICVLQHHQYVNFLGNPEEIRIVNIYFKFVHIYQDVTTTRAGTNYCFCRPLISNTFSINRSVVSKLGKTDNDC